MPVLSITNGLTLSAFAIIETLSFWGLKRNGWLIADCGYCPPRRQKIWGRKRHLLVDSQGYLLAVKVTGAERSEGGRALLLPLKEQFPNMNLLWEDSHYAGQMITWIKVNLGLEHAAGSRPHCPQARSARARGRASRLGQTLSFRIAPAAQKMGRGA